MLLEKFYPAITYFLLVYAQDDKKY
jgi:hypothetical protein